LFKFIKILYDNALKGLVVKLIVKTGDTKTFKIFEKLKPHLYIIFLVVILIAFMELPKPETLQLSIKTSPELSAVKPDPKPKDALHFGTLFGIKAELKSE